jgi:hypothetical protein
MPNAIGHPIVYQQGSNHAPIRILLNLPSDNLPSDKIVRKPSARLYSPPTTECGKSGPAPSKSRRSGSRRPTSVEGLSASIPPPAGSCYRVLSHLLDCLPSYTRPATQAPQAKVNPVPTRITRTSTKRPVHTCALIAYFTSSLTGVWGARLCERPGGRPSISIGEGECAR